MARASQCEYPATVVAGTRPAGVHSTALWLRSAFADLHYDIHHSLADGDLVAVNSTMNGRHVAPWAVYTEDGDVDTVFPPTRKPFAMTQSHWFRVADGRIVEHWANRDDLGMAKQLGWVPPTPVCLFKMARAKRRVLRSSRMPPQHVLSRRRLGLGRFRRVRTPYPGRRRPTEGLR